MPAARRWIVIALSTGLAGLLAAEVWIRSSLPAHALLDTHEDAFWGTLLEERLPGLRERGLGSVRLDPRLGWRMDAPPPEPFADPPAGKRVVVLGDSFTQGLGVPAERTYAARLAAAGGLDVRNLGVNGYGTDQQLLMWREEGARLRPDLVLLASYVPNFHRNALRVRELPKPWFELEDGALRLRGLPLPSPEQAVELHSTTRAPRLRSLDLVSAGLRRLRPATPGPEFRAKAELSRALLRELHASVAASGATLHVLLIPHHRLEAYPDHGRIAALLAETCRDAGIPFLDLTPTLAAWRREHPAVPLYGANEHWTAAGHLLAARRILEHLGLAPDARLAVAGGAPWTVSGPEGVEVQGGLALGGEAEGEAEGEEAGEER